MCRWKFARESGYSQEPDQIALEDESPYEFGKRDERDEITFDDRPGHTPREKRCNISSRWPGSWPGHAGDSKLEGAPHARFCIDENTGIIFGQIESARNASGCARGLRIVQLIGESVEARCQHVMIDGSHHIGVEGPNMVARSAYEIDLSIPKFVLTVDSKELRILRMGIRVCTGVVLPLFHESVCLMCVRIQA